MGSKKTRNIQKRQPRALVPTEPRAVLGSASDRDVMISLRAENQRLKDENKRLQKISEHNFRAAGIDPADQCVYVLDGRGDMYGVIIVTEGFFLHPVKANRFATHTNELAALATAITQAALWGTAGNRRRLNAFLEKQQGLLAAAYLRFTTFLEINGDDPSVPPFDAVKETVRQIEQQTKSAIQTGNYAGLGAIAKNIPLFNDVLRAIEQIPIRQRGMIPMNQWLAENAYMIRDTYLRAQGTPQAYLDTGAALLDQLETSTEPWAGEAIRLICAYTDFQDGTGLKEWLSSLIKRYRKSTGGALN